MSNRRKYFRSPAGAEKPVFLPVLRRPVIVQKINFFFMLHSGLRFFAQLLPTENLDLNLVSLSVELLDDGNTFNHHRSRVAEENIVEYKF